MRLADSADSVITVALMRLGRILFVGNGRSRIHCGVIGYTSCVTPSAAGRVKAVLSRIEWN